MIEHVIRSLACFLLLSSVAASQERVEFNRDIRPILSDNCFYCHGNDQKHRKADLRIDTFDGATDYAIVPGEPDESEVLRRILSDDPDEVMPPPESEKTLSKDEKELVRRWIKQGAKYEEHWAWAPLRRPAVLDKKGISLSGPDAIDSLLAAGWKENNAQPVEKATPRQILRRLSFDLRGLMPTAKEVAQFAADPTDKALFEIRDRWMQQLPFAEHQAIRWLDLVRWADTSGFVSDEPIASGAYRAWVIRSFLKNQPFDQFSKEQLAGDLLHKPTDDQLIASGYNRIVNTNCEAGAIEAEQLYKLKGEHVRALGTVWMGMTTGCAECHDHKFDPFSAKDYYSLAAFFDDLVEAGVYTPGDRREPLHYVYKDNASGKADRELQSRIARLKLEIAAASDRQSKEDRSDLEAKIQARLNDKENRRDFVWIGGRLPASRVISGDYTMVRADGKPARETFDNQSHFERHFAAEFMSGYVTLDRYRTDADKDAWFVDVWIDPAERPAMIGFQISCGDYGRLGWRPSNYETYYWGEDTSGTLSRNQPWSLPTRVKRIGDMPDKAGWVRLRVPEADLLKPAAGQKFEKVGMAWIHTGGRVRWGDSGLEVRADKAARLELMETMVRKWWEQPYNRQSFERRDSLAANAFLKSHPQRDQLQKEAINDALRELSQPKRLEKLRELESELSGYRNSAMPVLVSRRASVPKTTRLLNRGDYQDNGPIMSAAVPDFLATSGGAGENATRLDLANWLFDQSNHLVARVYVNRMWHQFYGRGISESLEDSGTQGDWPSHLQLLDWLAFEFRDSGWDRNHMVRLLTSTKAYQLSSTPSPLLAERDPGNRFHARQGRSRLTAESIRDITLQTANLLTTTKRIPTQSFFPYQPSVYWSRSDKVMYGSRHMDWNISPDRTQHQRSLYTFWKRQNIHPTMLAFDAPTRQECTAKRNVTNTPGQALALLNGPIFVEAARVLATRVIQPNDAQASTDAVRSPTTVMSVDDRLNFLFEVCLQRQPRASERKVLTDMLQQQREHFSRFPDDASQLVAIGQTPVTDDLDSIEVAAWTTVTRTVLNLHEFLTRQ